MTDIIVGTMLALASEKYNISEQLKFLIEEGYKAIQNNRRERNEKRILEIHKNLIEANEKINLNERNFDVLSYEFLLEACLKDAEEQKTSFYSNLINNIYLNKIKKNKTTRNYQYNSKAEL